MAHEKLQVTLSLGFALITLVGWLALVFQPYGWIKRVTVFYTIDAGLNSVRVSEGVVSAAITAVVAVVDPKVESALSGLQRRNFGMQEFREYMCQLSVLNGCSAWGNVQHSSWLFMIVIFLSMIAFGFGAGIDYYYHFVRARKTQRRWVRMLYLASPVANMLGLLQYCLLAEEVNSMQPSDKSNPLGPNVWIACILLVCNWVPFWAVYTLSGDNLSEDINEEEAALNKHKKEEAVHNAGMTYGAMGGAHSMVSAGAHAALQEAGQANGPHNFQQPYGQFAQPQQPQQSFQGGWSAPPPNQQGFQGPQFQQDFQGGWAAPDPHMQQQGFQGDFGINTASPMQPAPLEQPPQQQVPPPTFQEQPPPQSTSFSNNAGTPAF